LEQRHDANERAPSFSLNRPGGNIGLRFAGIPLGHEFTSLVLALLQVGGHPPKVEADVIEQVKQLKGPFHFETFVSLTCHNCPEVVQALNLMAVLNPNITHVMIDGGLYQQEVEQRQIMAVPTIYLNGKEFGAGRMEIGVILVKIYTDATHRDAEQFSSMYPYDVLVIGGFPACSSAVVNAA